MHPMLGVSGADHGLVGAQMSKSAAQFSSNGTGGAAQIGVTADATALGRVVLQGRGAFLLARVVEVILVVERTHETCLWFEIIRWSRSACTSRIARTSTLRHPKCGSNVLVMNSRSSVQVFSIHCRSSA